MTPDEPLLLGLEGMPRRRSACTPSRACPAGQAAAGPPRRPWDGLPDEPDEAA